MNPSRALLLVAMAASLLAQPPENLPPAFPREGAAKMFDNSFGTVWDVTWRPGKSTPMHRHAFDYVAVELADAAFSVIAPDGQKRAVAVKRGDVNFFPRGVTHIEEASDQIPPRHAASAATFAASSWN